MSKGIFLLWILSCPSLVSAASMQTAAAQAILMEINSGKVLFEKNANQKMFPSSMTKMMTIYLAFDSIKKGLLQENEELLVSHKAWKTGGSKMFVEVNRKVPTEQLIYGVLVSSGNDATIVIAERLGGSEENFAKLMTKTAHAFGLKGTNFLNSSGLPDENHFSTAYDIAIIAKHNILDFYDLYKKYYGVKSFKYNNITQENQNHLLNENIGVDGLKTGHTEIGGYGVAVSAPVGDGRLVVVVNGLASGTERMEAARSLILYGQRNFRSTQLTSNTESALELGILCGTQKTLLLTARENLFFTQKLEDKHQFEITLSDVKDRAPIIKGEQVAVLQIKDLISNEILTTPLLSNEDIAEAGFIKRNWDKFKNIFFSKKPVDLNSLAQKIEANFVPKPTTSLGLAN